MAYATRAAARCLDDAVQWTLLASLGEAERAEVLAHARRRRFARNEVVCHAGDPADSLHLVESGHLSVRVSLASGESGLVNVLGPGDYFGELALLRSQHSRTATITALEAAETLVVTASAFRRVCDARPGVERALTTMLADRIDELSERLLEMMYVGLDRRLYRRLADLAHTYRDHGAGGPIMIPLTQSQLAELAGGTRPTVNQALQRLVDQGVVAVQRGRIEVLDLARLTAKCAR